MGLFGKGKKKQDAPDLSEMKKHETMGALAYFVEAVAHRDEGEVRAALMKKMKCTKCGHEFRQGEDLRKAPDGGTYVHCPSCGQRFWGVK